MQANQQQNVLNSVHAVVQSNVSKMYSRIDAIIESAKEFVTAKPENGQKIVDHVTSYTKYMHKVIEEIIQSYSALLEGIVFIQENQEPSAQEQISQNLQEFKAKFAQNIERAKNATNKIQSLLTPLVQ